MSGELLNDKIDIKKNISNKSKLFIGSSSEGLNVARAVQSELEYDFSTTIWSQGIFNTPGKSFLESLEDCIDQFDYGVFIFTPDDKVEIRGKELNITRDNVIFELGLFVGKLGRFKSFILHPRESDLQILTDFEGIVKLNYDSSNLNIQSAVGAACERIRKLKNVN